MSSVANSRVDACFAGAKRWGEELKALRRIVLDCGLIEELKWGAPCYTFEQTNVIILGEFKACCVISFFKGALLKDAKGILEKAGPNTRVVRVVRFTDVRTIREMESTLRAYIREAVELEKAGVKASLAKEAGPALPEEFQTAVKKSPALQKAFAALTPGRQRGYALYFSAAKQSKTRLARIEKCAPRILEGKGLE
jgi:uncharacterized protein YdeI (YjbR/CyaY-like superfamily)